MLESLINRVVGLARCFPVIFQIFNAPYFVKHLRTTAFEQATIFKNNFETEFADARTLVEVIRKNKLVK